MAKTIIGGKKRAFFRNFLSPFEFESWEEHSCLSFVIKVFFLPDPGHLAFFYSTYPIPYRNKNKHQNKPKPGEEKKTYASKHDIDTHIHGMSYVSKRPFSTQFFFRGKRTLDAHIACHIHPKTKTHCTERDAENKFKSGIRQLGLA
jgi:hypothetical protein